MHEICAQQIHNYYYYYYYYYKVITLRTLLHLGSFITFRPPTHFTLGAIPGGVYLRDNVITIHSKYFTVSNWL